jgi:chromosome segregation and condensation protein ScpB
MRGLVERIDNPKDLRGYVYKISFEFLKKLGIDSINKLPDYDVLSKDERIESVVNNN